jgi:hypothetical protein
MRGASKGVIPGGYFLDDPSEEELQEVITSVHIYHETLRNYSSSASDLSLGILSAETYGASWPQSQVAGMSRQDPKLFKVSYGKLDDGLPASTVHTSSCSLLLSL